MIGIISTGNDATTTTAYLSDKDVDYAAKQVPAEDLEHFITKDLGLSEVFLSQIRETFGNDIYKTLHEGICRWRNKLENSGQNAGESLRALQQVRYVKIL